MMGGEGVNRVTPSRGSAAKTLREEPFLLAKPCKNCSHSFTVAQPKAA